MNQPQVVVMVPRGQSIQHVPPSAYVPDAMPSKRSAKPSKPTRGTTVFCLHPVKDGKKHPSHVSLAWVADHKKFQPSGQECKSCGNKKLCAQVITVRCSQRRRSRLPTVIPVIASAGLHRSTAKTCQNCRCGRELCAATKQLGLAKN